MLSTGSLDALAQIFTSRPASRYGSGLNDDRVNDGEGRGGGADPERKRQNGGAGEGRIAPGDPQSVAEVAPDLRQQRAGTRGTDAFFDLFEALQLGERRAARLLWGEPRSPLVVNHQVNVRAQLVVELALGVAAAEQVAKKSRHARPKSHRPAPIESR